jgi:hypothetical protein
MPFTATHVAAAVPLAWIARGRLPFSALAIGSMIPDIPVFFPGLLSYQATHSLAGIVTHGLPVGFLVFIVFHFGLKQPLVALAPRFFRARLASWAEQRPTFALVPMLLACISVAAGAASHVVWDSFTHEGRWGVQLFPVLDQVALHAGGRPLRWYAVLQHLSSAMLLPPLLVGFGCWALKQRPTRRGPEPGTLEEPVATKVTKGSGPFSPPRLLAIPTAAVTIAAPTVYFVYLLIAYRGFGPAYAARTAVIQGIAADLLVLGLYCASMNAWWWFQSGSREDAPGERTAERNADRPYRRWRLVRAMRW